MTSQERDLKLQIEEAMKSEAAEGGIPKLMDLPEDQWKNVSAAFYQFEQYKV